MAGKIADWLSAQNITRFEIANSTRNGAMSLRANAVAAFNMVWNNSHGLTPQQVCDALGSTAVDAFQQYAAFKAALEGLGLPNVTPLPDIPNGFTVTPNADGTVSIAES